MAIAILAIVDVHDPDHWSEAKDLLTPRALQTREIIRYWRERLGETISDGSYDDVRRKDLLLPYLSGMVATDDPRKHTTDGTRRYGLNPEYSPIIRGFGARSWHAKVREFVKQHGSFAERLNRPRNVPKIRIVLPFGGELSFLKGPHNQLQKSVIEEFLPRFGFGAEVLYVGDTAKKFSWIKENKLQGLKFFDLKNAKLPDIVAYSETKNWIYLIEAVHSANPMTPERRLVLAELMLECTASPIYVTAFLDTFTFRKFAADIAWETEAWIASDPTHLIHFNGEKFLGPFQVSL